MAEIIESYTTGADTTVRNLKDDVWVGQTFTIGTTGNNLDFNLSSIEIPAAKWDSDADPKDTTVEIYEVNVVGLPTGTAISTGTLLASVLLGHMNVANPTGEWKTVTMSEAILRKGKKYALILRQSSSGGGLLMLDKDDSSPSYAGGNRVETTDAGDTWSATTTSDLLFAINGGSYEGTLCSLADASNKAGANASSFSTAEGLLSDFVKQAEGLICAVTRFNWVKEYASLNEEVRTILNQVASDIAATYAITYDMSGYTDRIEAETMINVYRETIARGLSLLRDQKVRTFLVEEAI